MMEIIESADQNQALFLDDIETLKVVDLKKQLKLKGLPTSGNKTELIQRLQESYLLTKNLGDFDSSQELHSTESDDLAKDTVLFEEVLLSSPDKPSTEKIEMFERHISPPSETKPLKKRTLAKSLPEEAVAEKKVFLNRTSFSSIIPPSKSISSKNLCVLTENKTQANAKTTISLKNMTESEKLAMRAKRFQIPENNKNSSIIMKKVSASSKGQAKLIASFKAPESTDIDILKKRAERFGQNVSTVMKQIEDKEKLLKRKLKFGACAELAKLTSENEQEKKKKRAERFGLL